MEQLPLEPDIPAQAVVEPQSAITSPQDAVLPATPVKWNSQARVVCRPAYLNDYAP